MARIGSGPSLSRFAPLGPSYASEADLMTSGHRMICGVDEAGRGPLAGPVVAAAVILDPERLPDGVDDSKRLTAARRDELFEVIVASAVAISIGSASARTIDRINIRQATLSAMRAAICGLPVPPCFILIDGNDPPRPLPAPARTIVKGDATCLSIAAASIIAKVTRDRMLARCGGSHPGYGLETHAGYGTPAHRSAISERGPVSGIHRQSFGLCREMLVQGELKLG